MEDNVTSPISVDAEIKSYTLVGDDIYIMKYDSSSLPQWYRDLIENALSTSGAINNLQDLINTLNGLSDGYTISISNLSNSQQSMYTELTSLSASLGQAQAAIVNLDLVKVTANDVSAISQNVVGAYFNTSAGSWFDSKISTYASNIEANASNISSLTAVLGNQEVRIDTMDSVILNVEGWAASASKLITAPDGTVTGWSFADGTGVQSEFKVYADTFVIQGATGAIDYDNANVDVPTKTSDLYNDNGFTTLASVAAQGYVLPSGVATAINTNSTTISGSKITTGTVNAAQLNATAISGQTINISSSTNAQVAIGSWSAVGGFTTTRDKVAVYARNTSGIVGNASFACDGAEHGGYFIGNIKGVYAETLGVSNEWGFITYDKTYSGAGYLPFTGAHIAYSLDTPMIGDIVEAIDSWVVNINQAYMQVKTTSIVNSKKVLGVCSDVSSDVEKNLKDNKMLIDENGEYLSQFKPYIDELLSNRYNQVSVNSLGEGGINVCGLGGDIEIGDYICSSTMTGKGMKQSDDLLHNYTVAKSLENVVFDAPDQVKMISCTYHCG